MPGDDHGPLLPAPSRVMLAGDWHGSTSWALACIRRAGAGGVQTIVQLGDFGFWTAGPATDRYLTSLDEALAEHGVTLLWTDGNHEDHERLTGIPLDPRTGLRRIADRIWHLPRGFRWQWHGVTWMAVGGAHSVDRRHRTAGVDWWPAEHLTRQDIQLAARPGAVDVMVTHDAPAGVPVPGFEEPVGDDPWPAAEVRAARRHRALLQEVVDSVVPAVLFHGHYHRRYDATLALADGVAVAVQGLARDGAQGNVVVLDAAALAALVSLNADERAARRHVSGTGTGTDA